ncbi:amidase family protein [Nocardia brasiliensis]|uniref:amidase family protein n=1 Tax=Nocardia brasiliensis TaxID=37326 RepID=UPI002453A0A9|nr:amidase family protein [Nocardia brasiliensis]
MREAAIRLFDDVDLIAAPAVPATAARAGQDEFHWPDGTVETVADAYVRLSAPANITGIPAMTIPVGHDPAGLPIGMQFMTRPLGEPVLLRAGHAYERTTPVRQPAPVP